MHNPANRSIRLVLISVASLDGMLKSIAGLSSSIKFAGYSHFINNYLGGKIQRESVRVKCLVQEQSTQCLIQSFTPDHLHHHQFKLLINIKYYLLQLGDTCISVKLCLKFLYYVGFCQVQFILEAIGNAVTVQNNNSSRFAVYYEVYFSPEFKLLGGKLH